MEQGISLGVTMLMNRYPEAMQAHLYADTPEKKEVGVQGHEIDMTSLKGAIYRSSNSLREKINEHY
jgi:hypothetical protein